MSINQRIGRWMAGVSLLGILSHSGVLAGDALAAGQGELAKNFAKPPADARPWVYWYWINGTMTREGVTADLEAMQRVGIGGVMLMEVDHQTPGGPVKFGSPEWRELFKFVCAEAARLGMQINMANDAGWCGSAGPWITPELSMQKMVWTETAVQGPQHVELALAKPAAVKDYYREIGVLAIPVAGDGKFRIADVNWKAGFKTQTVLAEFPRITAELPAIPAGQAVPESQVVDLGAKFQDGKLTWDVPEGKWIVFRFGYTTTGKTNHPAPVSGTGLEVDRLSTEAMDVHFAGLMEKLIADAGPLAGKTLVATHIDSWESGAQNWTLRMREEFKKRRGYDMTPFLPVMTGRVVDSLEASERFLWDLRLTLTELLQDNYAGHLRTLANKRGLRLSIEAYDWDFCDNMAYAGRADEPQGEFWNGKDPRNYRSYVWCANMASAAHTYGKRIVGAEAFTSMSRWGDHPATLKVRGDWAFCEGINRFLFHTFTMQPWANLKPGMGMGPWGLHYERTQTWWEQTKPWHEYLTRCQFMLRQGLFVADLCYLQPEGAPMRFQPPVTSGTAEMPDRPGYNYDGCTPEVVLTRMTVKDGRLVLPDGMSYRALVLPEPGSLMPGAGMMTPQLLGKIVELVEGGATLIGTRPVRSPSLVGYPGCDAELKKLADRLWGSDEVPGAGERSVGKGRVVWGKAPAQVLAGLGVVPDFDAGQKLPAPVRYIHRRLEDGTDLYFVANKTDQLTEVTCAFRVTGRQPEIWWPRTGRTEPAMMYNEADGVTRVSLRLPGAESVFVVFRAGNVPSARRIVSVERDRKAVRSTTATIAAGASSVDFCASDDGKPVAHFWQPGNYLLFEGGGSWLEVVVKSLPPSLEITGPWEVRFPPHLGAPQKITLDTLSSWSGHADPGVKYFSGTATYRKTFSVPTEMIGKERCLSLDLGRVGVIAEVKLNGRDLGVLWKPPYTVDVTSVVRAGENTLEVQVTNLWVNRLIGDEQLPADVEWGKTKKGSPGPLAKWPDWLTENKPRTSGRIAFTTWKLYGKTDPLQESGLLGPVRLEAGSRVSLPEN